MLRVDNSDDINTVESSFNLKAIRKCNSLDFEKVGY